MLLHSLPLVGTSNYGNFTEIDLFYLVLGFVCWFVCCCFFCRICRIESWLFFCQYVLRKAAAARLQINVFALGRTQHKDAKQSNKINHCSLLTCKATTMSKIQVNTGGGGKNTSSLLLVYTLPFVQAGVENVIDIRHQIAMTTLGECSHIPL